MTPSPVVSVRNLSVEFGAKRPVRVVSDLSFDVMPGETVAVVGESGSGKSVTALSIMGLLPEHAARQAGGTIVFEGRDLATLDREERRVLRGPKMGMIFQEPMTSLNPVLTIGRQVTEALQQHLGLGRQEADDRAAAMLERVGIGNARTQLDRYPHEFSGGMRQRVMIAAVMALKPRLLIADEPTTALDVTVQAQVMELMRELVAESGASLLLITHDMGVVAQNSDRVVVMHRGEMVETQPVRALFANPAQAYTRRLLAAVPRLGDSTPQDPVGGGVAALKLTGIAKSFGHARFFGAAPQPVLRDVSLEIAKGEVVALVGESGSGKSTLGRIACRLLDADAGEIQVDGMDMTHLKGAALRKARRRIQMIFQDPFASLDPSFTIGRTLAEPLLLQGATKHAAAEAVARLLETVRLSPDMAGRYPHQFSGGQRQRIAIARALAAEPSVIVADEPTSALDVSIQAEVIDLLLEMRGNYQMSLLFITHDLGVVSRIANRVAVMRAGRIVELGPVSQVLTRPEHPYTRSLLSAVPVADPERRDRILLPMPADMPMGPLRPLGHGHWVAA